jgi:hypothetical protein
VRFHSLTIHSLTIASRQRGWRSRREKPGGPAYVWPQVQRCQGREADEVGNGGHRPGGLERPRHLRDTRCSDLEQFSAAEVGQNNRRSEVCGEIAG